MTGLPFLSALLLLGQTLQPFEQQAAIVERLGAPVPLGERFTTADGQSVLLADVLSKEKPTLLVLSWFECPMLCGLVLKGVVNALQTLERAPGDGYRVVTVSFDPRDTVISAAKKRDSTFDAFDARPKSSEWPFLIGDARAIESLTSSVGFQYAWESGSQQFAHPAAAIVITPQGRVSRYLYGIDYSVRDLRLALAEASLEHTRSTPDRLLLTCFRYDPATRRYGLAISWFLRAGGSVCLFALLVLLFRLRRTEARRSAS